MTDKIIVLTNCGSEDEARKVARLLVEARVAACVNIVPRIHSVYRWKGAIQEDTEWMLVIKSNQPAFETLRDEIRKAHSYELPEVVAIPVIAGAAEYLEWIDREVARK
jgi:periplasmic divalent cation tolerance protein